MSPSEDILIRRFLEEAGNTTQTLGVGRVVGQIFAYLYFSESARSLDDLTDALGISKGSASMGVRQLEQWGAAQRVWVKGDRKDYYTANDYFGRIIRSILLDLMGKRLDALSRLLDAADEALTEGKGAATDVSDVGGNHQFLRVRVRRLREFQSKVNRTWNNPIIKRMLK